MRPSVRKTTTLLRTIATSLRYAIDDGGVQARLSCRSAVSQACQSGSLCLKRALVGAYSGHTRVTRWMMQVALTEWVVFALQKRRFLAPNDPHVGADWIRRFDVVVAYADALATSAIAEKVIPVLLAPICCANRRSARRHSHGSAGVSARCSTWSKS